MPYEFLKTHFGKHKKSFKNILLSHNIYTFTKTREKDASFYNLPKNVNLTQRWLPNIKRENIPQNLKIFHRHFEEFCFKGDLEVMFFFFVQKLLSKVWKPKPILWLSYGAIKILQLPCR